MDKPVWALLRHSHKALFTLLQILINQTTKSNLLEIRSVKCNMIYFEGTRMTANGAETLRGRWDAEEKRNHIRVNNTQIVVNLIACLLDVGSFEYSPNTKSAYQLSPHRPPFVIPSTLRSYNTKDRNEFSNDNQRKFTSFNLIFRDAIQLAEAIIPLKFWNFDFNFVCMFHPHRFAVHDANQ